MKRLLCHLWGCWCSNEYPGCVRCGAALYDSDFVQIGHLHWISNMRSLWTEAVRCTAGRCDVCHKRMWFKGHNPCCSEECQEQWYPF